MELLLTHGADPNSGIDSSGSATWAAFARAAAAPDRTWRGDRFLRDSVWLNDDEEVVRRAKADPASAECGCGGVFTAIVTNGKRDLLLRLLEAGIRVPPTVTGCRSYLMENPRNVSGSCSRVGPIRTRCRTGRGRRSARSLQRRHAESIYEGKRASGTSSACRMASLTAREDEYSLLHHSAGPPGPICRRWSEFLIERGAPLNLPDDPDWATPSSLGKERRGHTQVGEILRRHGAARLGIGSESSSAMGIDEHPGLLRFNGALVERDSRHRCVKLE